MSTTKKQSLSNDSLIGIVGIIISIGAAVFDLSWLPRTILATIAIGLIIYAALRHGSHPAIRAVASVASIAAMLFWSWRPIWEDFQKKHLEAEIEQKLSRLEVPIPPPDLPPKTSVAPPSPTLFSTIGKTVYRCPRTQAPTGQTTGQLSAEFSERAKAMEAATGVRVMAVNIDGGIRMEVTAVSSEAKLKIADGKWALKIRNLEQMSCLLHRYSSLAI